MKFSYFITFHISYLLYSFHKKGKRIMAITTTKISRPIIKPVNCSTAPLLNTSAKALLLNRINNNNCGKITGKPSIAISAALCCALPAMALINVKTILIPVPPKITIPIKRSMSATGLLRKTKKRNKLIKLITIMRIMLYNSLLIINSTGEVTE